MFYIYQALSLLPSTVFQDDSNQDETLTALTCYRFSTATRYVIISFVITNLFLFGK